MPDKKLTDNEIVRAFEVLDSWQQVALQNDDGTDTESPKLYEAIEIVRKEINRLQTKLDEAEDTIQFAYKELKKAEAEVKTELDKLNAEKNDVMYHKAQIKAEAYKEFAERLKGTFPQDDFLRSTKYISKQIDNLLKELVGDNNV